MNGTILTIADYIKSWADWVGALGVEIHFHYWNGNPFDDRRLLRVIWDYCCGNY